MPEEGIFLSEFRPRRMIWQSQMLVPCFSGAHTIAASWRTPEMACAFVQRAMAWASWSWYCSMLPQDVLFLREKGRRYHSEAQCH